MGTAANDVNGDGYADVIVTLAAGRRAVPRQRDRHSERNARDRRDTARDLGAEGVRGG
jgi:hypothetical protein